MEFKHGEELQAIHFADLPTIKVGEYCDRITVSMEHGQMDRVPWFEVWKDGKITSKWNAAKVEGVLYP